MSRELMKLRKTVDNLDSQILRLLNKRANTTLEIGKIKKRRAIDVFSPDREKEVYERITMASKGPMPKETLRAIYREIMSGSLSLEKPLKVAYMGPQATFTHLAAMKKFGSSVEYVEKDLIAEVFDAVEKGTVDYGVVLIENSLEGAIDHTLDRFMDADPIVKICSEISVEIRHNLIAKSAISSIKRVYSNPTVFEQCRSWLAGNLPKALRVEFPTTSMAAAYVASRPKGSAAIASDIAAKKYSLRIIARSIEDRGVHNVTRFLVIGKTQGQPTRKDKTSIMLSLKDKVGALHDLLVPFKKAGISLTKIESRPSKKKAWEYYFFVDFIGHYKGKNVTKALSALEKGCTTLKVLGSYPVSD
ncbi:MAG: prephenate dehydratase [Candidatus Omnitrophota bacterium]